MNNDSKRKRDWTTKELAEAADVSDAYIRHLLLTGKLQGYKAGRDWLIPELEARKWLEERKQ